MIGRVVSTKMIKTVIVLVERIAKHPLYKKTYSQSKRYPVDDPIGVKMGDMVEISKVKPISRNKHWRIVKVVGKNLEEITEEKLKVAAEKVIAEALPAGRQVRPEEKESSKENKELSKKTEVVQEKAKKIKKEDKSKKA